MDMEQATQPLDDIEKARQWGDDCLYLIKDTLGWIRGTVYDSRESSGEPRPESEIKDLLDFFFSNESASIPSLQTLRWLDGQLKQYPANVVETIENANVDNLSCIQFRTHVSTTALEAIQGIAKVISDECDYIKTHFLVRSQERVKYDAELQALSEIENDLRDINLDLLGSVESQLKIEHVRARQYLRDTEDHKVEAPVGEPISFVSSGVSETGLNESLTHKNNFSVICYSGKTYRLSKLRAACFKVMWENQTAGRHPMKDSEIITEADDETTQKRLRDVFKNHPIYGEVIIDVPDMPGYRKLVDF